MNPISSSNDSKTSWAVVQIDAGSVPRENLDRAKELVREAAEAASFVALPEFFIVRGDHETIRSNIMGPDSEYLRELRDLAESESVNLLAGSIPYSEDPDPDRCFNRSVMIHSNGEVLSQYDKMHLFDVDLEGELSVKESGILKPGDTPVVASVDGVSIGFSICYDLRFSSLYDYYAGERTEVITAPSNFTRETGRAHWIPLLRARAIETQSYVIAPNQIGENPDTGIPSLGQSCIVDPWGQVVARCSDYEGWVSTEIDMNYLRTIRRELPSLEHGRSELKSRK